MKHRLLVKALGWAMLFMGYWSAAQAQSGTLRLWYDKPAGAWNEALPIGNGRVAAMVYGAPAHEQLQLNEASFWSGGPSTNNNPKAKAALPQVRRLIFEGKHREARDLANQTMTATQLHGSMFQVVGSLKLRFAGHNTFTDYYRELDLEKALCSTGYKVGGVGFKRQVFASEADQLIVVKLTADQAGMLNFVADFSSPLQQSLSVPNATTLQMTGLSATHEGVTGQVKFDARAQIIPTGGTTTIVGNSIQVQKANEVVILISMATNFVDYKTLTANPAARCNAYLKAVQGKGYGWLLQRHLAAYQPYFNRVRIDLGSPIADKLPTDQRVMQFSQNMDPSLVALYYQFGRYLLISCSQPGGQPANLQGLWNNSTTPAWDSKYTININTEMNYWPAEKCNLSEMHEPLLQMVADLSETGAVTAQSMYGCNGWVAHHNTDLWRISGVVDFADAGLWPMGGAWLSQHLWERYLYRGDTAYLRKVYPILKSACLFYQDFLVAEPEHNRLVVSPSISPENTPPTRGTAVVAGTTMDNQLLFDLFGKTIRAAAVLQKDSVLMARFRAIQDRLPPMQIGQWGQLQEWMADLDSPNDKHRHVSHLYGMYPGNQITARSTPELFQAARNSLVARGDVSTGWSMGWKVNLWARLQDGNHALKLITDQLTLVDPRNTGYQGGGGTYPNLFDAHPPFQIDGNFGCTAGIAEMLMQSHAGHIQLLPAMPDRWAAKGAISGLCAYGGFELSFIWVDGRVSKIELKSKLGGNCRIHVANRMMLNDGTPLTPAQGQNPNPFFAADKVQAPIIAPSAVLGQATQVSGFTYDLPTEAGRSYELIMIK